MQQLSFEIRFPKDIPSVVQELFSEYEYLTILALRELAYSRVWARGGLKDYGTHPVRAHSAFGNAVEEFVKSSPLYRVNESKFLATVNRNVKPIDKAS